VGRGGPATDRLETFRDRCVRLSEHAGTGSRPGGEVVAAGLQLVEHLFDAGQIPGFEVLVKPVPERRTEVESVLEILGLNEDVGVEQVFHGSPSR